MRGYAYSVDVVVNFKSFMRTNVLKAIVKNFKKKTIAIFFFVEDIIIAKFLL